MGWCAGEVCGPPNIRLLPLEGAPRSGEDRPLRSKGAADRRHFTNESHQALSGPRLFYEKPAILRRLRRHRRPGIKVFALCAGYAHILARLRSPLQGFCLPKEGGFGTPSSSTCDTKDMHVTLTIYSSPQAIPPPFEPSEPFEPFEPIPLWCLRHHLCPGGKHVTGFSGRCAPLQIQFLCHPASGGTIVWGDSLLNLGRKAAQRR